jgi:hypothetical protein
VVDHRVAPHRLTRRYVCRRSVAQGVSDERMRPTRGALARAARVGREALRIVEGVLLTAAGLLRREGAVTGLARVEYARGRLLALVRSNFRV